MSTPAPISSEPRAVFMARVRSALGSAATGTPPDAPPPIDESIVRLVDAGADLAPIFAQRAAAVGMHVHRTSQSAAADTALAVLTSVGARRLVSSLDACPFTKPLHDRLVREGFDLIDWRAAPGFGAQYDADAGITGVEAAIAESGTLVCTSGPGRARGLSLVPPIHVALVRAGQIVPDLIDFWKSLPADPGTLPSSLVLITGPSKTADIEGVLITGVHGPREVHVVLIDDA